MFGFARWCRRAVRSAAALTAIVAVVGVLVAVAVGAVLAAQQREAGAQQLQRRGALVTEAVAAQSGRYVDAVRTVAAAAGAAQPLTAAKFAQATAPLDQMRLAGATSIVYLVPAADEQIPAVQQQWRDRGATDLTLQPVGSGKEHIFSVVSQALDGTTARRAGIDATQSAAANQALTEARRSGHVAISDPYQLIIDKQLPAEQRQMSFSITAPVYGPPDARGQRPFQGWVLMGLRGRDFIGATLTHAAQESLDVTLRAPSSDGSYALVAEQRATTGPHRDLSWSSSVVVADRSWRLEVTATAASMAGWMTGMPFTVTGVLMLLALLLAGLVWLLATSRTRALAGFSAATTELAQAEADARRQADLLTAILDNVGDGVGVVDHDGQFLLHNPAAKTILGITDDPAGIGNWQHHYGMFALDGTTAFPVEQMPLVRALAGDSPDHTEMIIRNSAHPDGLTISVSARPLHTADGTLGAVAVFHDITARKANERALADAADAVRAELQARTAAEARLREARDELAAQRAYLVQVLDAIDVTVITCDLDGTIVHANRTARRALPDGDAGRTVTAALPVVGLTHPDGSTIPAEQTPLLRAIRGEEVDGLEAVIDLPDGSHRSLLLHARPLRDQSGDIVGAVAASYNVTALREREADLRAFAGVAAHDLKSPLTAIAGYAEVLTDELTDTTNPMVHTSVQRIATGIDRMRRLIDDLLAYATARDSRLHQQPVDLNHMVAEVIAERTDHLRTTASGTNQQALFPDIYTGPLPTVYADPAMIRQLLDNLIGNAIKYTPAGQPARIDIASHQRDDDEQVSIVIADRGIGIPAADQPHVFDTFHRAANHANRPGTGLGLAICKRIIDRHGGTITVTDNPGGGSRFRFTLPTATDDHRPVLQDTLHARL